MTSKPAGDRRSGGGGRRASCARARARRSARAASPARDARRRSSAPSRRGSPAHAEPPLRPARRSRGEFAARRPSQSRARPLSMRLAGAARCPRPARRLRPAMYSAKPALQHQRVTMRPAIAPSNTARSAAKLAAASPPLRSAGRQARKPESRRVERSRRDTAPRRHVERDERADGRRLVPAVRAVHHPRALDRHAGQRVGHQLGAPRRRRRSAESAAPPDW